MVKRFFLAVFILLLAANFLSAAQPIPDKSVKIAKDFTLKDSGGNQVSLSDFKDKPVILFFWATWCPHCRGELNTLNQEYEKIKNEGVELLAINVGESHSKVDRFIKGFQLPFRVLLDEDTGVTESYDIIGVPTHIFIDKGRNVVYRGHHFEEKKYNLLTSR